MSRRLAGLYVHIPFCRRICPYCDFAVRTGDRDRRRRFVDDLVAEIDLYRDHPLEVDTIYFGGGTPSSLESDGLERIIDSVRSRLRTVEGAWIGLEANPEDVTPESVAAWRRCGVVFLSLGVQSLDDAALRFLGRGHDAAEARRSADLALEAGIDTVSVDLIYGRPEQTAQTWEVELGQAAALGAHHVSCYQLTIHPRTRFGLLEQRGQLEQLASGGQADLFRVTHRTLNDAGYQGYEVSNFARSDAHRSRHNSKYWDHTPYLGLGPSAHSFHDRRRWWNLRRTDAWQEQVRAGVRPVESEETLDVEALVLESLMTGLRTYRGVDFDAVRSSWGVELLPTNLPLIERLQTAGLASLVGSRLVPTLDGLAVADSLPPMFDVTGPRA